MKKSIILLSALVLLVAGCSDLTLNDDEVSEDSSSTSETTTESEETPDESSPTTPTDPGEGGLPEGATEMTFKDQNEVVEEAAGIMYFWNEQDENHVDIDLAYNLGSTSHIEYSVLDGLSPVWYGIQLFLELSETEKETYGLTTGDEYTVSLSLKSSVSGTITINGVETDITAGDNTISVTSTTRIGASTEVWDSGNSEMITLYTPTLLIQLGKENGDFLGGATIEVSNLSYAKTETSDTTEAITASGLAEVNTGNSDGKMHYWTEGATINEATHNLTNDTYTFDYSNASGNWWNIQLFWFLDDDQLEEYGLSEGDSYTLSFDLVSSISGTIKVVNESKTITAGTNHIEISSPLPTSSSEYATFHIWFADEAKSTIISEGRFVISNIQFEKLDTSAFTNSYQVSFGSTTLHSQEGEYYASRTTQTTTTGGPGTLERWAGLASWGAGADVTVTNESLTENGYSATYSTTSSAVWYAYQLFYTTPDEAGLGSGKVFEIEMDINVSVGGYITINNTFVQLVAGDNHINVTSGYTSGTMHYIEWDGDHQYEKTDLELAFGTDSTIGGHGLLATQLTFTISSLTFNWN